MPTHHGLKNFTGLHALCDHSVNRSDHFGRIFSHFPPLYIDPRDLAALGDKNGPMKATGPAQKTSSIPVGHIFFGQFIDHDITLDLTSSFARLDQPEATPNARTPTLDLDNIYGAGPDGSPYLYYNVAGGGVGSEYNGVKILTGADAPGATALQQEDLARSLHGRAMIGDPRNDENRIISQLQLAMIRFHNRVAEVLHTTKGLTGALLMAECRRTVTWHYHWVVINDYLRLIVGKPLIADIFANGRRIYRPDDCPFGSTQGSDPFIPVEFSVAAFRYGHSMIPQRIQIQAGKPALEIFGPILGLGFSPLNDPKAVVQWPQVLDLGNPTVDRADKLDAKLAADLLDLPFVGAGDVKSLALRNLLRGQAFRLPCGERIAEACDRPTSEIATVSAKAQVLASAASPVTLAGGTPLWLYILVEAAEIGRQTSEGTFDKGEGLGPVGGRIVAETLIGLMELDNASYLGSNRAWSPALGADKLGPNGLFTLLDLLTF